MRAAETAEDVATRSYRDKWQLETAVYEHNKAVRTAQRKDPDSTKAVQPLLCYSGTTVMGFPPAECGIGPHGVAMVFFATPETHRIEARREGATYTDLCARHWSELLRDEEHVVEVRYARPFVDKPRKAA